MKYYFVYKITNLITNKIYFGKTHSIKKRWNGHKSTAKNKDKSYSYLHRSINKYGFENFSIMEVAKCLNEQEALSKEIEFIQKHKSNDRKIGYNLTIGGEGACGYRHTDASRKLMSDKRKGKFSNNKNPFYGKQHSDEFKLKQSELQKIIHKNNKEKYDLLNQKQCPITTEQCIIIQKQYLSTNFSLDELAKANKTTISTINKIIHGTYMSIRHNSILNNIKLKEIKSIRKLKQSLKSRKFCFEDELKIIEDYNNKISLKEIMVKYQCSFPTINKIIKRGEKQSITSHLSFDKLENSENDNIKSTINSSK